MVGAQTSQRSGHPCVPKELNFPGFVPCILPMSTILGVYGGSSLLVVSLIWILSGLTHMILEGYFVFSPKFYQEKDPHYLAEVWLLIENWEGKNIAKVILDMQQGMLL